MIRPAAVVLAFALALPAGAQVPSSLSDSAFGALSAALSEPSGFFDTDNLVSNEDSYLHAVTTLQKLGLSGGAYLGVGPDQNFSYIAAIKPRIAVIVDIRRDNLLELLLFKSIFALSRNRIEYLCLLFGKVAPADTSGWAGRDAEALFRYIDSARSDSARAVSRVRARVQQLGIALSGTDLSTIARFHRTFIGQGPAIRLTTFGRGERNDYPDFRRLVLEKDRSGRRSSYLAAEAGFLTVKALQDRNLVVPVVGDFAGERTLVEIGRYLKRHGEMVTMFYTSNVEQYLVQDGILDRFAKNVVQLPRNPDGVMVRSFFPYGRPHPQWVEGYLSVQLVQRMDRFLTERFLVNRADRGSRETYHELVTKDLVEP